MNIADHASSAAESPALIIGDGDTISFGELYANSQRVAAVLHDAGLRRGDGVALVLPNRPEFFEITWGCQLSGLYYTAVNTHFTPDEVVYVIDDSDAKAVFVDASMGDLAAHLRSAKTAVDVHIAVGGDLAGWQSYDDALAMAGDAPPASDGSEMLYSSGTTGRPKAVRRPLPADGNGSWAQSVLEMALIHKYGMSLASVYLSPAPMYHAAGVNYTMAVNRVGAAAIIMRKFDAEAVLRLIETHRVTHAQFVPTMFVRMLKLPKAVREKYDVSSLQCVIHAAAPCPTDVKHQMMKWFGPIIHEYYGGTEGFAGTTIGPEEWLAHPGSVGIPMAPVHVVGQDGRELPVGESGELYFEGGPDFAYFKDPTKTASVSNDRGWRSLGDVGYVDEDGYLYLTDRSTFMIVSGGVNIYPQEAENLLVTHPKLVDAAVFGVPNDEFGEEVKAVVQPVDGITPGPDLEAELIEYCRTHLAGYKCPRTVEFDPELPRDPNGKLYKRRIRERYWQGRVSRIICANTRDNEMANPTTTARTDVNWEPLPVPWAVQTANRIPKPRYYDPDFYAMEAELFWPRVWQMACRLEEIPKPGDFVEYEILDESIIVVRVDNETVRAYHNACRHRGVKLVEGNGNRRTFVCPFHGWCWGIDGRNTFVLRPEVFAAENLRPDDLQLVSVRCELWGGCAWINLDDNAPALRDCMEPFASIYDAWKVESLRVEWWQSCRLPVNWKLATAAFMEGYHVPQTHPQLLPSAQTGSPSAAVHPVVASSLYFMRTLGDGMGGMTHENDIRIAEGLQNIELPSDPAEAMIAWRSALNDAVVSWHRARGSKMPDLNDLIRRGITDAIGFCFPHHFILPTYSSASSYRIRPLGPEETLFEIWSLTRLPADLSAGKPTPPEPMAPDDPRWPPIPAQDFSNLPRQQKGLHSKGFEFMRLSDQIEGLISNFERVVDGFLAGLPYDMLVPAIQKTNTTIDVPIVDLGFTSEAR